MSSSDGRQEGPAPELRSAPTPVLVAQSMSAPKPKQHHWRSFFVGILIGGALFAAAGVALLVTVIMLGANGFSDAVREASAKSSGISESVLLRGKGDKKIVVAELNGVIMGEGSHISGKGTGPELARILRAVGEDSDVAAVILQVDSPGGEVSATDLIYHEVKRLREEKHIPVVTYVVGAAASGAYYASAPADKIIVSPTAITGSIGVIMNRLKIKKLLDMVGVEAEPIMSTSMKDLGSPYRDLAPEERAYLEGLVKQIHSRFISIVAEGRKLDKDKVAKLADGKVYTADESLANGLADSIGYFDDALAAARELGSAKDARVVKVGISRSWLDMLEEANACSKIDPAAIAENLAAKSGSVRIEMIWRAGN